MKKANYCTLQRCPNSVAARLHICWPLLSGWMNGIGMMKMMASNQDITAWQHLGLVFQGFTQPKSKPSCHTQFRSPARRILRLGRWPLPLLPPHRSRIGCTFAHDMSIPICTSPRKTMKHLVSALAMERRPCLPTKALQPQKNNPYMPTETSPLLLESRHSGTAFAVQANAVLRHLILRPAASRPR